MNEVREKLKWHRENVDDEENERSTPPEDEEVEVPCLWVTEFYPPSKLDALLSGLSDLGFDEPRAGRQRSAIEWIREARSSPYGTARMNLGFVTPPGGRNIPSKREIDLPRNVEYAVLGLQQIVPSHTALIAQFVFNKKFALKLDRTLREKYQAEFYPDEGVIRAAAGVKDRAVQEARDLLRNRCSGWFCKHVPGIFASGSLDGAFPSCEFLLFQEGEPFEDRDRPSQNYMWILGVDHAVRTAVSPTYPGTRFSYSSIYQARLPPYHSILASRERDLFRGDDLSGWGGRNRDGYANRLRRFGDWFAVYAVQGLMAAYEMTLADLRDSLSSISSTVRSRSSTLHDITKAWAALERDAVPFAQELSRRARSAEAFHGHLVVSFQPSEMKRDSENGQEEHRNGNVSGSEGGGDLRLLESIRTNLKDRCERLEPLLTGLGEALVAESNVKSAISSTRLQAVGIFVSTAIASAAIVALFGNTLSTAQKVGLFLAGWLTLRLLVWPLLRVEEWCVEKLS